MSNRARTHAESWHARAIPNIGTIVVDRCDPRHLARLDAVLASVIAVVRFLDTGCRCELPIDRIRRATPDELE